MKLRTFGDRVLVNRHAPAGKSKGGIVLPDAGAKARVRCFTGTVVAVGSGYTTESGKLISLEVEVGDEIIFGKFHGAEVSKTADEDIIMLRESDISGKIVEVRS